MMTWLKAFYEGDVTGIDSSDDGAPPMVETAAQIFRVVRTYRDLEWDRRLPMLQSIRKVAGAHDAEWLNDD